MRTRIAAWLLVVLGAWLAPIPAAAQATCTAEGFVLDAEGNPVPGVQVLLQYKGHNPQKYHTKTDRKGKFVHVNVHEGVYDLTFTQEGGGEVTVKDFRIREIPSLEKAPVFRLGGTKRTLALAPEAQIPAGSAADAAAGPPAVAPAGTPPGAPPVPAPVDVAVLAAELQQADAALAAGQVDEAIAKYEMVLASVPDSAPTHHNLGLAHKRKGDLARAESEFRRAAELKPDLAASHGALSVMLGSAGKLDEAITQAQAAAQYSPTDAQYAYNLGVLLKDGGRGAEAKEALLKAEALDPANPEIQFHLGTVELGLGQVPEAIARLKKYLAAAPAGAPNVATAKGIIAAMSKKD